MSIQSIYKTTRGTVWDTENEALIADALEDTSVYIESYRFKEIVQGLAERVKVYAFQQDTPDTLVLSGKMVSIPIDKDGCCVNYHKDDKDDGELG